MNLEKQIKKQKSILVVSKLRVLSVFPMALFISPADPNTITCKWGNLGIYSNFYHTHLPLVLLSNWQHLCFYEKYCFILIVVNSNFYVNGMPKQFNSVTMWSASLIGCISQLFSGLRADYYPLYNNLFIRVLLALLKFVHQDPSFSWIWVTLLSDGFCQINEMWTSAVIMLLASIIFSCSWFSWWLIEVQAILSKVNRSSSIRRKLAVQHVSLKAHHRKLKLGCTTCWFDNRPLKLNIKVPSYYLEI